MIYFLQSTSGGPIKIGCSDDPSRRHKSLETHYRRPLAILATMEGGRAEEAEIHARFDHLRLEGKGKRGGRPEQFRPEPELMEFIGRPLFVNQQDDVELMPGPPKPENDRSRVFRDRLRELVELDGRSQVDIAAAAGMTPAQLSNVLNGQKVNPRVGTVARILTALGYSWSAMDKIGL